MKRFSAGIVISVVLLLLLSQPVRSGHQGSLNTECAPCHEVNLFRQHGPFAEATCTRCHDSQEQAVRATITRGKQGEITCCVDCHGPIDHALAHDQTFLPSQDCAACHVANVAVEHESHGVGCVVCHSSLSPQVQAVIELGRGGTPVYCDACHGETGEGGHASVHAIPGQSALPSPECAQCHLENIVIEHQSHTLSCQTCHGSSDPAVQAAIAAGVAGTLATCDDCHGPSDAGHLAAHEQAGVRTFPPDGPLGAMCCICHRANVVIEHENHGLSCATCHASADPTIQAAIAAGIAGPLVTCDACHPYAERSYAHDTSGYGCMDCHWIHGGGPDCP